MINFFGFHNSTIFCVVIICLLSYPTNAQILCTNCYDQNIGVSPNVTNIISNGSFEWTNCQPYPAPDSFCPASNLYACDIPSWQCINGGISTYARIMDDNSNWMIIPHGNNAAYLGNFFSRSCSQFNYNDTLCFTTNNCIANSPPITYPRSDMDYGDLDGVSIEQKVNGLIPGQAYVLEFWTGGEYDNGNFNQDGLFAVDIGFGNTFLRNPVTQINTGIGRVFVIQFIADSSMHNIKFTNWGHACYTCTELGLDNVKLYPINELSPSVPNCFTANSEVENENSIKLYPNPTSGVVNIKSSNINIKQILFYDVTSKQIDSFVISDDSSFNINHFNKGIYYYQIKFNEEVLKQGKLIKF